MSNSVVVAVFVGITTVSAAILSWSVTYQGLPAISAFALLFFEALCILFLLLFLQQVMEDPTVAVESRWGGLGRGTTGWQISPALVYLACMLLFTAIFAMTTQRALDAPATSHDRPTPLRSEPSTTPTVSPSSSLPAATP